MPRAYDIYFMLDYPTPGAQQHVGNHPMCSSMLQTMSRIKATIGQRADRKKEAAMALAASHAPDAGGKTEPASAAK